MAKKKEEYDVDGIIEIDDHGKKKDEFDLGKDEFHSDFDDDDDMDFEEDFDDGGD